MLLLSTALYMPCLISAHKTSLKCTHAPKVECRLGRHRQWDAHLQKLWVDFPVFHAHMFSRCGQGLHSSSKSGVQDLRVASSPGTPAICQQRSKVGVMKLQVGVMKLQLLAQQCLRVRQYGPREWWTGYQPQSKTPIFKM